MFIYRKNRFLFGKVASASFHISMVILMLLAACGPANPTDEPADMAPGEQAGAVAPLPLEPQFYDAPELVSPTRTSPTADAVAVKLPPERVAEPVEFIFSASPAWVNMGEEVTLSVVIKNHSGESLSGLEYSDRLESGLSFISSASGVKFETGTVSFSLADLPVGGEVEFSYILKVDSRNPSYSDGELWLHTGTLKDGSGEVDLTAQAVFAVGTGMNGGETSLAVVQVEGGWVQVGGVAVFLPPAAVEQDGLLILTEQDAQKGDPAMKFDLSVVQTAEISTGDGGMPDEQRLAVSDESEEIFAEPVFLEVNFDQVASFDEIPAGQAPFIATYYEDYDVWVKVPILNLDYENNSAIVQTNHFSTWGAGLGNTLPQNGTGALLFDQPYISLFTGAAQYSIPIWTPPGRVGLSPNISLSYSSGTVNGVLGDVQAPWVGVGWNIDSAEIVRKITTNTSGYGYENSFALTLNGMLYELIRDEFQPTRYYVRQNAFLYIELHNVAYGNAGEVPNASGEWWEVVMTDGTRYRFGWNADSEQLALMYGYACTLGGDNCITPSGPYASSGYAGRAANLVTSRWRVDRVTDLRGNYIEYTYTESQPPAVSQVPPYDRSSSLAAIAYTGFDTTGTENDLEPGYQVRFVTGNRSELGDVPSAFNLWDLVDEKYLDRIEICLGPCGEAGSTLVRTYDLGYSLAAAPNTNGTLTLTSLAISGGDFSENGITIPATESATVRFTYENKPNRASGAGEVFSYPRLAKIENGYGGSLTYTYETDGRGNDSWYNYRVQKVDVDGGMGLAARRGYTYATPVYTGIDSNPGLGELIGYTTLTEKTLDHENVDAILLEVKHQFGTSGLDAGREYWVEVSWDGTVQQKTVNTYVTDNSAAPSPAWNFRYLIQTENYLRSAGALSLASKTTYYRDPSTGNLLMAAEHLGATLYRKTYHEYLINNDPGVHLLNTTTRTLLVDAADQIHADVRQHYDGGINTVPTLGELTLTQVRTGNGAQTVDTAFVYDGYGNRLESRLYECYGSLDTAPSGDTQATTTTYDTSLHTYPIAVTNALDETATITYLFTLGQAYQTSDANGWATTTSYDGLGRTVSVTAPGLGQPGVWYTYPAPGQDGQVAAPYAIEMQILDQPASTYRSVWGIYDGLGRILQNQIYDADRGQLLVSEVRYNVLGGTERQSLPHYVTGNGGTYLPHDWSTPYTAYTYDPAGRQTGITAPGGIESSIGYDGLTTTATDPNGNLRKQMTDGLGRMVQVQEFLGTSLYATTQYAYDETNRLVQVSDALANRTSLEYNWLGQKVEMDDPDMGIWTYTYNPTGSLASQTDATNQTLTFVYDDLNRLVEKREGSTVLAAYEYGDTSGLHGMRVGMSDQSGTTSWSYANYGRTITETRVIGDLEKTMTSASDWLGRVLAVTYPDGEVLTYQYDGLGRPDALSSNASPTTPLVELMYNQLGQIATASLGNGVELTNTYDPALRLETRSAENASQENLMDFAYEYDDNGNIVEITDTVLSEVHTYTYDGLNRLASALGEEGTSPGGDDLYSQEFSYNKIGNLLLVTSGGEAANLLPPGAPRQARLAPLFEADPAASISYFHPPEQLQDPATATPSSTATPTQTHTPSRTAATNTPPPSRTFTPTGTPNGTPSSTLTRSATPTPTNALNEGLMGYWNFDNISGTSVPDGSGRNHPGTLSGAQVVGGQSGAALSFDGVDDVVTVSYHADLAPAGSFSIAAWINPDEGVGSQTMRVVDRDGVFSLQFNADGYIQFQVIGLIPGNVTGPQLSAGEWNLVTGVYDSAAQQLRLYINGSVVAITDVIGTMVAYNTPLILGSSNENERYKGRLDEVRFYNRVLTLAEVDELHPPAPTPTYTPTPPLVLSVETVPLTTGLYHTCFLTNAGGVRCWGRNDKGQLGDGTTTNRTTPVEVSGLTSGVTALTGGYYHTCALTNAGGVKCWGLNDTGQLGDGTTTNRLEPVDVSGLSSGVVAIAAGGNHTCALFENGEVKCWGSNTYGQLGDGTTTQRTTPVAVSGLTGGALAIGAGYFHSCALTTGGGIKCWGRNNYGQLGDGTTTNRTSPVNTSGLGSGVLGIAVGSIHTCALTNDGGIKCWGYNGYGEVGDGTTTNRSAPVEVSGLGSGQASLGAGLYHTCALSGAGGIKCWGYNGNGQLGDGTTTRRTTPVEVSGLGSGAATIAVGGYHTCMLADSGGVKCWGYNGYGQLGDGTTTQRTTPVEVSWFQNPTSTPTLTRTSTPTRTLTNTPTATATTVRPEDFPWGTGNDGDLNVAVGNSFNVNTQNNGSRTCADGGDAVAYSITQLTNSYALVSPTPAAGCLAMYDEVLLINLQGSGTDTSNVGSYEFLRVASVSGNTVYFTSPKIRFYGGALNSDLDIGIGAGQQRVVLQRVPNYDDVVVNGTLTASPWNGSKFGVLAFRVAGTLSGEGTISTSGLGYRAGNGYGYASWQGESYGGLGGLAHAANLGGGGGGRTYSSGGGGGYASLGTAGVTHYTDGGSGGGVYGDPGLNWLFLGSGGGGGGRNDPPEYALGAPGGNGGGILFLAANQVDWDGVLASKGSDGGESECVGSGGGGAGGSLRIEAADIAISGSVLAAGGTSAGEGGRGGAGRIAIYPDDESGTIASIPAAFIADSNGAQGTATPISIYSSTSQPWGDGRDGDLQINSGQTINLNSTNIAEGRNCLDGGEAVAYTVIELTYIFARLNAAPLVGCLAPGDEILLINLQGSGTSTLNVGNYEFLRVGSVVGEILYFTAPKTRFYGDGFYDDTNIGTGTGQQRVVVQRVPNYDDVVVNGTLTASPWNGSKFGVLAFRVAGTLSGEGTISTSGLGYRAGNGYGYASWQGESYAGLGGLSSAANLGGGGGGQTYSSGGGGGYSSAGSAGVTHYSSGGAGGGIYGEQGLERLFLGSGGGGGGRNDPPELALGSPGGNGGGILFLAANQVDWDGTLLAQGMEGSAWPDVGAGGGGAGGSLRLEGVEIAVTGSVAAAGGVSAGEGGTGGIGRIAVYYQSTFSGSFTPNLLRNTGTGLTDSIFSDSFESGDLGQWAAALTDGGDLAVAPEAAYWGRVGLAAVIDDNNTLYVEDDTPFAEEQYRLRFYFNPGSLTMGSNDQFNLLQGYSDTTTVFRVQMSKSSGVFQVRIGARIDTWTWAYSNWYALTGGWNALELLFLPGEQSGEMCLWLGGEQKQCLNGLDTYAMQLDAIRMGAEGVDSGTRGTMYFDDFEMRRYSLIGELPDPGMPNVIPTPEAGMSNALYAYEAEQPHAVSSVERGAATDTYTYDENGNTICRVEDGKTYIQFYNAENRFSGAWLVSGTCLAPGTTLAAWTFTYDGDGVRVKQVYTDGSGTLTTFYFFSGAYEVRTDGSTTETLKYYSFGGQTILRDEGGLKYLLTDHLGSVVAITDEDGDLLQETRYLPYGGVRDDVGTIDETDLAYTGQKALDMQETTYKLGLMDYKARFYDPYLSRFQQPDRIVPGAGNPQAWNRYAYVLNSPLNYTDPSGHAPICDEEGNCYDRGLGSYRGTRNDASPGRNHRYSGSSYSIMSSSVSSPYSISDGGGQQMSEIEGGSLFGKPGGYNGEEPNLPSNYNDPMAVVAVDGIGIAVDILSYFTYYELPKTRDSWYGFAWFKPDPLFGSALPSPNEQPQPADRWWLLSTIGVQNLRIESIAVVEIFTQTAPSGVDFDSATSSHRVYPVNTELFCEDICEVKPHSLALIPIQRQMYSLIPPNNSLYVTISTQSESGLYGRITLRLTP